MEKDENKIDFLKECLTLAGGCACYKGVFLEDENEDFFPELTKEFDILIKKSESPTDDFENRFVSAATDFLENLVQMAFDEIAKRFAATYNERLKVKNVLFGIIESVYEDIDPTDLNTKSAIALQSVIPQLRKINQVYYLPLKDENARIKMTKGRYFLDKIERIQNIVYHFKSKTVNSETYINYENSLLNAYILAKRIEDADILFNMQGFYANVEGVCKLLEGESEELINQISSHQIDLFELLSKDLNTSDCDNFYRQACVICGTLDNETLSISSAIRLFLIHHKNGRLPKSSESKLLMQYMDKKFEEERRCNSKENEKTNQKIDKVYTKLDNVTEQCEKSFEDRLNEEIDKNPNSPFHKLPKEKRWEVIHFTAIYIKNKYNLTRTAKELGSPNRKSHIREMLIKVGYYKKSPKSGKKHGHKQVTRERNLTPQEKQRMN